MRSNYKTKGTCSTMIEFDVEDGVVRNVEFTGGCNGCGSCNAMNREAAMKRENPYCFTAAKYKGEDVKLCHVYKSIETRQGYFREFVFDLDNKILGDILDLYAFFEDNLTQSTP